MPDSAQKRGGLTEPQRALLADIVSCGKLRVVRSYRPAIALVEKGFADDDDPDNPGAMSLLPTPAGRSALSGIEGERDETGGGDAG